MPKRHRLRHPAGAHGGLGGKFRAEETPQEKKAREFIELAVERWKLSERASGKWRRDGLEDFKFYAGEQWATDIKTQRDRDKRPCLTINRLKPSKRIITNEYRQQRPAIQVNPAGDGATVETAAIEQGIVRHVEVGSDAEVGYDTAFDHMVISGLGWIELATRYQPRAKRRQDGSKPQEITLRGARNPFMHYWDPGAVEHDYSDAGWHFKIHDYTLREYKAAFPDSKVATAASLEDFRSVGDNAPGWLKDDLIRVAEYWYMKTPEKLAEATEEEEEEGSEEGEQNELGDEGTEAADLSHENDDPEPECWKALINAVEILKDEKTVFDSIPNVPMLGEDLDINGDRYIAGMVRDAKDPQRQFNFWESAITEAVDLAPKAPYKGYAEVVEGHEATWQRANKGAPDMVLTGNAVVKDGVLLPLPERESPDVPIQGLAAMRQSAAANLEAVTGLNDAVLGRMKPDESGKAVLARQKQGDVSNLNYSDNAARALRRVGRLLLPAIPKVYDVPTIMRIVKPDGTFDHVITHHGADQADDAAELQASNPAIQQIFDLSVGLYDVTISIGPSYQTKRQEAVASIMALIQAAPNVLNIVGDLLVGNMDWNNAPEIAKRLKRMLPPELQDDDAQGSPEQQLAQTQAQLAALTQVHQQVLGAFQQAQEIIRSKQIETAGKAGIAKMKHDSEAQLAEFDRITKLMIANVTAQHQDLAARRAADVEIVKGQHEAAHDVGMAAVDHAHATAQADQAASIAQAAAAAQAAQPGAAPGSAPGQ